MEEASRGASGDSRSLTEINHLDTSLDVSTTSAVRYSAGRRRSSTFLRKKKRVRTALLAAEPLYGRDTAYCCDSCCCVFWDSAVSNRPVAWRHCPVCGEHLVRGSQVSYSKTARSKEEDVLDKMRALAGSRPRPWNSGMEDVFAYEDGTPEQPSHGHEPGEAGRKLRRIREDAAGTADHVGDVCTQQKPHKLKKQDKFRFCDVCGHGRTEVNCSTCPSSFHKRCLNRPPSYPFPKRWTCHACVHRDLQKHGRIPEAKDFEERGVWKPPDAPTQCSSCGYLEIESVNCDLCERWFCFACTCLSVATVPRTSWFCPECVGQERYDAANKESIAKSRAKLQIGDGTAKEQDGFSQLVFDLSCGCNWEEWERNVDTLLAITRKQLDADIIPVMVPFHSLHYARPNINIDNDMIRRISIAYAKDTKDKAMRSVQSKDGQYRAWKEENVNKAPGRLRVGYISSDFVNHPTADLIQSALLLHDMSRFEVFCYSITKDDKSEYRRTLVKGMEHFRNLPKKHSDKHCADLIADDGIHVLVNLNGHTAGDRNGISALRPAPVQLVYLAYPGTMGADYIDYNVADRTVCPPEHREFYVERLLHMPFCYQTNSFMQLYPEILDKARLPKRKDHQLPDRPAFVFCNFCRLGRITPELFEVWVRILRRVPSSVIWLYKHPKAAVLRLKSQAVKAGISEDRFIFSPPCSPKREHLKRVTLADLCLDTLVYNGHTTASDMLWAGVPFITVGGQNWPSLVATALAQTIEMPEMAVKSLSQYEELAVELATRPSLLRKWKRKLEEKRLKAPLFDSERWVRSFEDGLQTVWAMYCEGVEQPSDVTCTDFGPSPSFQKRMAGSAALDTHAADSGEQGQDPALGDSDKRVQTEEQPSASRVSDQRDSPPACSGEAERAGEVMPASGVEVRGSDHDESSESSSQSPHDGVEETQYEVELDPEDDQDNPGDSDENSSGKREEIGCESDEHPSLDGDILPREDIGGVGVLRRDSFSEEGRAFDALPGSPTQPNTDRPSLARHEPGSEMTLGMEADHDEEAGFTGSAEDATQEESALVELLLASSERIGEDDASNGASQPGLHVDSQVAHDAQEGEAANQQPVDFSAFDVNVCGQHAAATPTSTVDDNMEELEVMLCGLPLKLPESGPVLPRSERNDEWGRSEVAALARRVAANEREHGPFNGGRAGVLRAQDVAGLDLTALKHVEGIMAHYRISFQGGSLFCDLVNATAPLPPFPQVSVPIAASELSRLQKDGTVSEHHVASVGGWSSRIRRQILKLKVDSDTKRSWMQTPAVGEHHQPAVAGTTTAEVEAPNGGAAH